MSEVELAETAHENEVSMPAAELKDITSETSDEQATLASTTAQPDTDEIVIPMEEEKREPTGQTLESHDEITLEAPLLAASEETLVEPIFAGYMMYRKTTATFPIFHKRYFFFADEPVSMTILKAFYEKHKKMKVDRSELNQLIARKSILQFNYTLLTIADAATSGKGLLFFSKTKDLAPSGILECSKVVDIEVDNTCADRFTLSYNGRQGFVFESTSRAGWIQGIKKKERECKEEIEAIKSSEAFAAHLKAISDGTAFQSVAVPEDITGDILSDDDIVQPAGSTLVEDSETPEKQKNRGSVLFAALKDLRPSEKIRPAAIFNSETDSRGEISETLPAKPKRKSFLSSFLSRKESSESSSQLVETECAGDVNENKTPVVEDKVSAQPEDAIASTLAALESSSPEVELSQAIVQDESIPKSATATPIKEKVDGFFHKLFRRATDKAENRDEEHVETTFKSSNAEIATNLRVDGSCEAPLVREAISESADTAEHPVALEAEPISEEKRHVPATAEGGVEQSEKKGIGKRLSSLFKTRRVSAFLPIDITSSPEKISEAPTLPETAKVEESEQTAELTPDPNADVTDLPQEVLPPIVT